MKRINRYYLVFGVWCAILFYAAFISNNVYFNFILFFFGLFGCIVAYAYIKGHENEKEVNFIKKLVNLLG